MTSRSDAALGRAGRAKQLSEADPGAGAEHRPPVDARREQRHAHRGGDADERERTNCHQVTWPSPTSADMQNGAVGGRKASTLKKAFALPELTTLIE